MDARQTPEQIAHQVAAGWIMGPVDMGDLEERIAAAIRDARRVERERVLALVRLVGQGHYMAKAIYAAIEHTSDED